MKNFYSLLILSVLFSVQTAFGQCAIPQNFYIQSTGATSATLGWINAANTDYEIEYGPFGFGLGNGTIVPTTANPHTINGLSGSTVYQFYLRAICANNDTSNWVGPLQGNTSCTAPIKAPFLETFENNTWEPYQNFSNQGSAGICWLRNPNSNGYVWLVNPNILFSSNSGPNGDHTTGSGQYVAAQRTTSSSNTTVLRSPSIDLSTVSNPEMRFWYHMYGNQIDKLEVYAKTATSSFTLIHTITGQQQNSGADPWKSAIISLSAYANQTVFIRFNAIATTNTPVRAKISIDDFEIYQGSSCPLPSLVSVSNIKPFEADISWNGGPGNYEINYGPIGFNPTLGGTKVQTTNNPHTLTGLTSGATYQVYVRKLCSSDTSTWAGPEEMKIPCLTQAPYTQDFDGTSWVNATFSNDFGQIDSCYLRSNGDYIWSPGPRQFPSNFTGPSSDHTSGNGKFIFLYRNFTGTPSNPATGAFVTEYIDLSALSTPELSFWYHMFGSQMGTLKVDVAKIGGPWTQVFTRTGQIQTSGAQAWKEKIVNLQAFANDTVRLRIVGLTTAFAVNTEMAIDDIDIHELPSCPKPDSLVASNVTFNSTDLLWNTGGASHWLIKTKALPNGTPTIQATSSNPTTINGLSSNTTYQIWVRDSCAVNDVSEWYGPIAIRTYCAPFTAPFSENFDGTNFDPWVFTNPGGVVDPCFRRSDTIGYYWVPGDPPYTSFQTGPSSDASGTGNYLYTRTSTSQADHETAIRTPWIDISNLSAPELRYKYHMFGQSIAKLQVFLLGYDGSVQSLQTVLGAQQTSETAPWTQVILPFTGLSSDTIQIVFIGERTVNGFQAETAIDEIEVANPQVCGAPTNVLTSNATTTSIDISWNSSSSSSGSNIEYGPVGFSPGGGTTIYGVTSPHSLAGLTPNTRYDFYVVDSCYWGALSVPMGPAEDTTLPCTPVTANISVSSVSGFNASFDATGSTGGIDYYYWQFGDGTSDSTISPTHTYTAGGFYTVTLIVSSNCGQADTVTTTIAICDAIQGQFTQTTTGLTINVDGSTSQGTGLNFNWDFGDGNTGTGATTSHTYAMDGNYTVSLMLTDTCGYSDSTAINVTVCAPNSAQINYTQNGLNVLFDGTSGSATSWSWDFGDGTSSTDSIYNHTYGATGTYQIILTTTNLCGETDRDTLILTTCNAPEASWTYQILSSGGNGMEVQFDGTASIGAQSFMWDFGDGNVNTTSAVPVHTYGTPGLFYVVTLIVENDCGDQDTLKSSLAAISIDEWQNEDLNVFPIPADDALQIEIPHQMELNEVKCYNLMGQNLPIEWTVSENEIQIATSHLLDGQYILMLSTINGIKTVKIVVKH